MKKLNSEEILEYSSPEKNDLNNKNLNSFD